MDRALALLGSLFAAAVVALGVARTADSQVSAAFPAGPGARPAPVAAPPYAAAASPAGVGDVLKAYGRPPAQMVVPEGSRALEWPALAAYEHRPGLEGLPDSIKALEGQTVTMRGFLMPLYEFDDIHEFVLVPNHMSCCFGVPAGLNAQVQVKIDAKRGLPNTNEPLEVTGSFRAVETKEQGYVLSIYRIDGAKVRIVGY